MYSCVIHGSSTPQDPDGLAGLVADTLQLMLMNLSLDRVSFSPQCNHTPSTSSVTCALVSPADEISSPSHDKTEDHQSCDQDLATPSEVVTVEENESEIHGEGSECYTIYCSWGGGVMEIVKRGAVFL